MLRKREAFTLLEMSIVLFIISLLILIVLPNLTAQRKSAKRIHRDAMVSVVQTQVKKAHEQHIVIVDGKVIKR